MTPIPDPRGRARLMQMSWAFAAPLMIEAGLQIGLFDLIEREPRTIDEVATATGASPRALAILMEALAGLELLSREGSGRFGLTADSATFLVSSKPESNLGGLFRHIRSQVLPNWLELGDVVRTGRPSKRRSDQPANGNAYFAAFVEGLLPLGWPAATALAEHLNIRDGSVLDIGAGSGVYSIPFAVRASDVKIVAIDLPEVLRVTRRIAARYGVADRLQTIEGDMATVDFGRGHRVAAFGQILHSYDAAGNRALIKKAFDALAPGGTLAIAEFLIDHDRSGPLSSLIFAANMLVNTERGSTYSFDDIRGWLAETGFVQIRSLPVPGPSPLILADRPA
jgi:3-hydroxy-5-methyl-1-naphthoate 3-O-methyltransferase